MANDYSPPPDARSHAWQSNFVTYVNAHLVDLGLAAVVMGVEIWARLAWASHPRSCDPPATPPPPGCPPQKTQSREGKRTTLCGCPHFSCNSAIAARGDA